jgi:hypothetical protein
MTLVSKIAQMERLLGVVDGECSPQCPHAPHFLGRALPCPDEQGCWDGCQRAKEILLQRVALMGSRLRSEEWQV